MYRSKGKVQGGSVKRNSASHVRCSRVEAIIMHMIFSFLQLGFRWCFVPFPYFYCSMTYFERHARSFSSVTTKFALGCPLLAPSPHVRFTCCSSNFRLRRQHPSSAPWQEDTSRPLRNMEHWQSRSF